MKVVVEVPDEDFKPILTITVGVSPGRSQGPKQVAIASHAESHEEGLKALTEVLGHDPEPENTLQVLATFMDTVADVMSQLAGGRGRARGQVLIVPFGQPSPVGQAS